MGRKPTSRRAMMAGLAAVPVVTVTVAFADDFRAGDGIVTGNERCGSCRFYQRRTIPHLAKPIEGDSGDLMGSDGKPLRLGSCHRFAPGATSPVAVEWHKDTSDHTIWSDHSCGEYRPRPVTWVADA